MAVAVSKYKLMSVMLYARTTVRWSGSVVVRVSGLVVNRSRVRLPAMH